MTNHSQQLPRRNRLLGFLLLLASATAFAPSSGRSNLNVRQTDNKNNPLYASSAAMEGIIKTVSKKGFGQPAVLGDIATVKYSCYLPDDEKAMPFARAERQKMVVGDGSMVAGWDKALRSMSVGERAIVRVTDPTLGYGEAGVPPFVPANAQLEFDIELLESQPATANIDFDSLATADNTPRTAAGIQAAYEERQAIKALEGPEKEGLEGFIAKAKNFYFFGLFEGETGQQAPWYLRPSITFPLAFLIVGGTFYFSFAIGAISERGAAVQ
eukprot:CAMPEP_0117062918 /NCGR_PEP_ID=MMETSP0472-20121206/43879_1 /TAXON_ID=693140 ORGANISM="Tiarina fusus, Strain LIS" /NCGR_SAMPLE_ID=MMETSP0472 /ASSEMBLY_ACC=CAM_ASM_000603 /LENGTH=269 /DNA_ID=CAMNT_0004782329 /DNA_START=65 /DNA_END=871 /DNA_ORIENTATION=+